ncbi:cobamide remodeling phosphodiesterase CbiR [Breznakiellaceae bacterium SP9]
MMSVLAVPSWVRPGTYLENLRFLEGQKEIQAVELLFFIYDEAVALELDREWEAIVSLKSRFLFTAHLPDPLLSVHEALIERLSPHVQHFIIHCTEAATIKSFQAKYGVTRFVLENTFKGHFEVLLDRLDADTKICMDTGHLLLEEKEPLDFYLRYQSRITEIHLHGIDRESAQRDKRLIDHRPIRGDESWFAALLPQLERFSGIINTEVFSWEEAQKGIRALLQ